MIRARIEIVWRGRERDSLDIRVCSLFYKLLAVLAVSDVVFILSSGLFTVKQGGYWVALENIGSMVNFWFSFFIMYTTEGVLGTLTSHLSLFIDSRLNLWAIFEANFNAIERPPRPSNSTSPATTSSSPTSSTPSPPSPWLVSRSFA